MQHAVSNLLESCLLASSPLFSFFLNDRRSRRNLLFALFCVPSTSVFHLRSSVVALLDCASPVLLSSLNLAICKSHAVKLGTKDSTVTATRNTANENAAYSAKK